MMLTVVQARVLGALLEKEITTPEYYPLTLNSLLAACNQKSAREPVMTLQEDDLRPAVHGLQDMELVAAVQDGRVPRYENRARTVFQLRRDETAVLCLLLLRGPQTAGELRGRSDRLFAFEDIPQVLSTLQRLAEREQPMVVLLPRQPGSKESRYAHTLCGAVVETALPHASGVVAPAGSLGERVAALEMRVERMERLLVLMGGADGARENAEDTIAPEE